MSERLVPRLAALGPEHLKSVRYRADHADYVAALGDWNPAIESGLVRNGGVALLYGREILAMAGVAIFWEGVGQLWMRAGERAGQFPVAVMKATREYLRTVDAILKPRRLQCHVKADSRVNRRFIEHLGFHSEALMRAFGPEGADYVLYARVRIGVNQ